MPRNGLPAEALAKAGGAVNQPGRDLGEGEMELKGQIEPKAEGLDAQAQFEAQLANIINKNKRVDLGAQSQRASKNKPPAPKQPSEPEFGEPPQEPQETTETQEQPIEGESEEEMTEPENPEEIPEEEGGAEEEASPEDQLKEQAQAEVKQKIQQRIKSRIKKFGQDLAKKFSKEGLKAAGRAIWAFIVAFWPYILAVIVIIVLIAIIFRSCSRESGKTPYQPLDRQVDERLVLQFLAASGEKSAQRELIAREAMDAKKELENINLTDHFKPEKREEAQKDIDLIKKYIDEIVTLSDNASAVTERVNQINQLLDHLNKLSGSNPTAWTNLTGVAQAAEDNKDPAIEALRTQINLLPKMISFYQRGHLVVNPKDVDYVRNYDVDRRIVQMLVYLVTPLDQGGAGHERLRVKRIKFSYDTENKSLSKETEYAEGEEPNVSAHYSGQAADITEIDNIKCTQIKRRRLGSDKKTALPPIPIKVAWQTQEGYMKAGGPDAYGQNMHQIFNNLASGATNEMLIEQISDILGIDLDPAKLKGKSFDEIVRYVGIALLKENLDLPGDYELGSNLEDLARNTGQAYLAEALGVPLEGIQGGSPDEMMQNIGRAILEDKMGLPIGALSGNNSSEIFASTGRRILEESLNLSRDSLKVPFNNLESLKRDLGQGRIESSLGLKRQTFYGGDVSEVKKRLGGEAFAFTFANPEVLDNWLGIATGSTENLIKGQMSPDDYSRLVGDQVLAKDIYVYQEANQRAEVFGVSADDLNKFLSGDQGAFTGMGKFVISRTLTVSDKEQELLRTWFDSKNLPPELDEDYLAGQYGLKDGDLGKIFVSDLGNLVFQRVGQVETLNRLQNNSQLSSYLAPVKEIRFYYDRLNIIKDNFNAIKNNTNDPEIRSRAEESLNVVNDLLSQPSITDIKKGTKKIQENIKIIKEKASANDPRTMERIKIIEKAVNEIIEGREISDFESLSTSSMNARTNPQTKLTREDIKNLLLGRTSVDDLAYRIGLKKWEIELDLPDGSLQIAYEELKKNNFANPDETLLSSIGKARINEYGDVKGRNPAQVDRDLGLPSGTTADYQSGKITQNAYYMKVGMGANNNIAAALLNKQLQLTDDPAYALKGTDVAKLLNGGWFWVALKIGGSSIDKALGFPTGGTLDIIQQSEDPTDVLPKLAEKKFGLIAGLDRPVSLDGDIPYNLGLAKVEQYLFLRRGELNEGNLVEKIKNYTSSNENYLSYLDMAFGLAAGESQKLIGGSLSPKDYLTHVGNYLRDSVIYDQLANYAPDLRNKEIKEAMLALAEGTGSPQEILEAAGANKVGGVLGLDYPVSIRGNFKDNLGQAMIEDRLGLKPKSFKDSLDTALAANGQQKFESAFYLNSGQLSQARQADSGYWNDDNKNQAKIIDAVLNIPAGSTQDFLTGKIDLPTYVDMVGKRSLADVTTDKMADLLDLEDKYKFAAQTLIDVFSADPSLESYSTKVQLYNALAGVAGVNLDNQTKFDAGTWQRILFKDPNDPNNTGLKNAGSILLEQGKKWLPRWMGLDPQYEPYIDLIYEKASGLDREDEMANAIKTITGIPDDFDAKRILHGDNRGFFTSWGAAQLVELYNKEFAGSGSTLDYQTAKKAYFNDPDGEKAIGDAAVATEVQKNDGQPLAPEVELSVRQQAIREARDAARKEVQYKAVDMQLHKLDKNIPPGFTQAMREGTSEQKWQMGLLYLGNMVHDKNPNIPADILPSLEQYFNPDSPNFHNPDTLSSATYSFLDQQLKNIMGDFVQTGTAKALFKYGQTGNLGQPDEPGTLSQIYANYGINIVCNWADKQLNLPTGSTFRIYEYYTKWAKAQEALHAAKIGTEAYTNAKNELNNIKASAITFVLTTVFQKQLTALDQQLGLVPGSSAMLVGMAVQQWLVGAINPWSIGLFVVTNLFGVYRIDVTCTACGYYPAMGGIGTWQFPTPGCPLGEFDGKSESSFRQNAILAAQYKVKQLLGDLFKMPVALNDTNLIPTQIMTLRGEDVENYSSELYSLYGATEGRGNSGLWPNDLMWDHIHVGY